MLEYNVNDIINVYSDPILGIKIDYIKPIQQYIICMFYPCNTDIRFLSDTLAQYIIKRLSCIDKNRQHWSVTDRLLWNTIDCLYRYR